ncbi:MAG: ABC transporter permease [Candidatus Woesearchaeota archaeon]
MNALWLLTKKNLRLLIRAKGSALIVVFAPLLIILILGLSFNNASKYGLNIGVYSPSFNEDTNSFIDKLQEQEFKIIKYNLTSDCVNDVKQGFLHTCIALPESFKIEGNSAKELTFYIDPSKINLVWMIQQTLESKLHLKAQEVSQGIAQDMISKISDTNTKVSTEKGKVQTVKEKDSAAASNTNTAKSNLNKLDLSVPTTSYDLEAVNRFKTTLTTSLSTSTSKINGAKTTINNANLSSSDRSTILAALTQAGTGVSNASALLTATSGNGTFAEVYSIIDNLKIDLELTNSKLNLAAQQVSSSTKELETVSSSLTEGIKILEGIQTTLEEINNNLNSQKVTDASVAANPFVAKIEKISPDNTYLNYMFPALIILVIMFSSLLLGTTLVMMEKNSPAFTRNFFLPIKKVTFVLSTYITTLILILIQVIIILGISLIFLNNIYTSLLPLALILFLTASVFTFLGMVIGYLFSSEETAILASISLGSLLLFVSGVVLPLESISPALRDITSFNPFVLAEKLVREVIIFNAPLTSMGVDMGLIFCYTLALFLIILIIESLMHQQIVNKFFHHHHHAQREKDKKDKSEV